MLYMWAIIETVDSWNCLTVLRFSKAVVTLISKVTKMRAANSTVLVKLRISPVTYTILAARAARWSSTNPDVVLQLIRSVSKLK